MAFPESDFGAGMHLIKNLISALLTFTLAFTGFQIFTQHPKIPQALKSTGLTEVISLADAQSGSIVYLPFVTNFTKQSLSPKVNIPYFPDSLQWNQMAIFWFGQITPDENYTDVRVAYTPDALRLHIAIIDRRLWCSPKITGGNVDKSDSVELYLDTASQPESQLTPNAYRITGQLGGSDCPESWTIYRGSSGGWSGTALSFKASTGWRGDAPNNDIDDRGWTADYNIPFSSLGLSAAPNPGTVWKLAVVVHDRNNSAATVLSQKQWPDGFQSNQPVTWADLSFGLPTYTPPSASSSGQVTVRNRLNGISVTDAQVGGGTVCGENLDFWTQWGQTSYPGSEDHSQVNIQNQGDIADWPCFSKLYITFPINSIPKGKVILSAQLSLHQFGNAGNPSDPNNAPKRSLIQVFTVGKDWDATTLTWNNAPQMMENVSQAWVDPLSSFPGWPGVLRTWDVSRAVAKAYAEGSPLRLALYSADDDYHSGKYFVSSYTGDWNAVARPQLTIVYGNP